MGIDAGQMTGMGARAVFLDRDGIINTPVIREGRPYPPQSLQEFVYVEGIGGVLRELRGRGFELFVVTNQPDVARGTTPKALVEAFHARILAELPIRQIYSCYHDGPDACECRKPKPGFLLQAAGEHGLDLGRSFMVGDRWRDIDCGHRAGCATLFVDYGYREALRSPPTFTVRRVTDILQYIH